MPTGTGADIPECATNFIGAMLTSVPADAVTPTYALNPAAPYNAYGTESDRLNNLGTSGNTGQFGVDKTTPGLRRGIAQAAPALPASVSNTGADTVYRASKPVSGTDVFRYEYLDERSGFYNAAFRDAAGVSAQKQMMSLAGHLNPAGLCVIGTGAIGATFVTNPGCTMVSIAAAVGPTRIDGWQPGVQLDVPVAEDYYGYRSDVTDAAGNTAAALFQKLLVNTVSPFATGLGVPANLTAATFDFFSTYADSAEVVAQSLQLVYPNLSNGATYTDSVRYTRNAIGTAFDDVITSPFAGNNAPTTGTPYARRIEIVNANAFPASNVEAVGVPVNVKPTKVQAWSWNHGSTLSGGPAPTPSAEIAIPGLNVQNGADIATFNINNPSIAVNHWRVIPSAATTNQFGSTVPLRAQAASPTGAPNPPFARVDFYRLDVNAAPGTYWSYLGSVQGSAVQLSAACNATLAQVCGTDQGTYRSWVYQLPNALFVAGWNGAAQTSLVSTNIITAVGVTSTGDAIATLGTVIP
jgi:hypothetical protein